MPTLEPRDYQPPLTMWSHIWRVAVVFAISALASYSLAHWQWDHARLWLLADLALGLVSFALIFVRRRHALSVAVATAIASAFSASAAGPATLALVSLATRRRWVEILPVATLSVAAGLTISFLDPTMNDPWDFILPFVLALVAVNVGWGLFIGSRRELLAALRERAATAEAQQSLRVAQAQGAERARIAREMHDVLAHRISMVAMHAGALAFRADLPAADIRTTSTLIQENAHQALVDLRVVLGILRADPDIVAPELPQPALRDLDPLIDEARNTGLAIDFCSTIDTDSPAELAGRTAYRIVQEGLTNARKHAPDTTVTVCLDGEPLTGLHVQVVNPLRIGARRSAAPPSGLGLIGLTERVDLAGGRLCHKITDTGEFILEAWLPWSPPNP